MARSGPVQVFLNAQAEKKKYRAKCFYYSAFFLIQNNDGS